MELWLIYLPSDSDDKGNLSLTLNEEGSLSLGVSLSLDESGISVGVLLEVLGGVLLSNLSRGGSVLLGLLSGLLEGLEKLGISGLLLKNIFWDNSGSTRTNGV